MHPTTPLHPVTGLAAAQPAHCLLTDEDLVRLAAAEEMVRGHMAREALERVGLEHLDATG